MTGKAFTKNLVWDLSKSAHNQHIKKVMNTFIYPYFQTQGLIPFSNVADSVLPVFL